MTCWKCGKELGSDKKDEVRCQACDPKLSDAKNILGSALARADQLGEGLDAFKEKIKKWRESSPNPIKQGLAENRDINRCIHYLCLMADELEEKIASKIVIAQKDASELEEKALYIAQLAKELTS